MARDADGAGANAPLIDTHFHLTWNTFAGQEAEVVERARAAGVVAMIDLGTDLATSRQAMKHSETFDSVWFAAGVHPNDAAQAGKDDLSGLRELLAHPKCVAVGEIGLDFYRDHTPPEVQEKWLRDQLELAVEFGKPVVLHDRESSERLLQVLEDQGYDGINAPGGVFHCFAGDSAMVGEVVHRGFHLSFTGNVTFKKTDRIPALQAAPIDRLMVETDAPFMAPVPHRGKPNEPAYVSYVAAAVATHRGLTLEEVARQTSENAVRFFNLPGELLR